MSYIDGFTSGSLDLNKVGQHISKQTGLDDTMDVVQSWQRGIGISDRQVQAVGSATTDLLAGSGDAASLGFAAQDWKLLNGFNLKF